MAQEVLTKTRKYLNEKNKDRHVTRGRRSVKEKPAWETGHRKNGIQSAATKSMVRGGAEVRL